MNTARPSQMSPSQILDKFGYLMEEQDQKVLKKLTSELLQQAKSPLPSVTISFGDKTFTFLLDESRRRKTPLPSSATKYGQVFITGTDPVSRNTEDILRSMFYNPENYQIR